MLYCSAGMKKKLWIIVGSEFQMLIYWSDALISGCGGTLVLYKVKYSIANAVIGKMCIICVYMYF